LEHAENLATTPLEEREAQRMAQAMAMCRKKLGIKAADGSAAPKLVTMQVFDAQRYSVYYIYI